MTVKAKRAPVRQPVQIPLVVLERGAQIGEVGGALGARVRRQVDALGRQPVAAGHDLLAPPRALRLAGEEDAVLDEVLDVEFRTVQRGFGEPVAALLDEDDVSVIERPVRIVEEIPERIDGAATRSARRREHERIAGALGPALDDDHRQDKCLRGVGLGRATFRHGEPAARHAILVLGRHVDGAVVLFERFSGRSGQR